MPHDSPRGILETPAKVLLSIDTSDTSTFWFFCSGPRTFTLASKSYILGVLAAVISFCKCDPCVALADLGVDSKSTRFHIHHKNPSVFLFGFPMNNLSCFQSFMCFLVASGTRHEYDVNNNCQNIDVGKAERTRDISQRSTFISNRRMVPTRTLTASYSNRFRSNEMDVCVCASRLT